MWKPQVSVTLAKAPRTGKDETAACTHPSVEEIAEIANDKMVQVAQMVAVAYVGKKVLDTMCQIAIITAQAKLK